MSKKSNSYDEKNWALDVRINAHKNFSITTLEDLIESLEPHIPEESTLHENTAIHFCMKQSLKVQRNFYNLYLFQLFLFP